MEAAPAVRTANGKLVPDMSIENERERMEQFRAEVYAINKLKREQNDAKLRIFLIDKALNDAEGGGDDSEWSDFDPPPLRQSMSPKEY